LTLSLGVLASYIRMMKNVIAASFIALMCVGLFAATTGAAPGTPLSQQDHADITRVENYIASIDTVEARFMQVASDGSLAEGKIYIQRPGRMRIDYAPPFPIEVIATGNFLVYHDKNLKQVSHVPFGSTPAGVLLKENPKLLGDVTVTGVERGPGALRVKIAQSDDLMAGTITLVFSDGPLTLRKWVVTDAQGVETTVSLIDTRFGGKLDSQLFEFTDPYSGARDD
jgi:outer membrane lipoprotein-sorting protein